MTQPRTAIFAITCTLVIAAAVAVEGAVAAPVAGSFDPVVVDRFITTQMARHGIPGLALAITHGDRILHVRGYGEARDGVPVTGQTQFRIASLSKSFTALAALQLVDAGQIGLDAPVARYLPDFALATPASLARITVRQLLNHTSGLADAGFVSGLGGQQQSLTDRTASLGAAQAVAPPGAAFHYFDPNYQLLARLVEVVSGQAFATYLQQHIFAPLDMRGSVSALTSALPARSTELLAQGRILAYGTAVALPELSGFLAGSGGVVSNASDLAHFLIAQGNQGTYLGRSVLSANGVSLTQTPPVSVGSSYAMGWIASSVNGTHTIEHNGVLSTFYADAVLRPQIGYGFVLLYNTYALTASMLAFPEIKSGMVALLMGQAPASGKFTLPWLGRGFAAVSALIAGLAIWSLWRLPQWKLSALSSARWKVGWGLLWPLAPALLLLALPRLLAIPTGRYFDLVMLARAMPELIILLGICAALALLKAAVRLCMLVQKQGSFASHAQTPFMHLKRPKKMGQPVR